MIGRTLAHYRIDAELGRGGMGVVYRAFDLRLERPVAIKVLPPAAADDPERRGRFLREARAASALSHPNIVTVFAVESTEGTDFLVMELVDGEPLDRLLAAGPMPIDRVAALGRDMAEALAAAHAAGIVHRDIKPANILVTPKGLAKVVDFGLARSRRPADPAEPTRLQDDVWRTAAGVVMGSSGYMSPEQARGDVVNDRTDVFALGAVLYEMTTGRRAFAGATPVEALASMLNTDPPAAASLRRDVPADLDALIERCLRKDSAERPAAQAVATSLESLVRSAAPQRAVSSARGWRVATALLVTFVVAMVTAGAWWWRQSARAAWARDVALPEIRRLGGEGELVAAYHLATEAVELAPDDNAVRQELANYSLPVTIETSPPGAEVAFMSYREDGPWTPMGRTPVHRNIPFGVVRWRLSLTGHDSVEATGEEVVSKNGPGVFFTLPAAGTAPPGMVFVTAGPARVGTTDRSVPAFWIDRLEVTNRAFKAFVDGGGYQRREFWTEPFVDGGSPVPWDEAIKRFLDTTGRLGPAGWSLGTYPEGQADHPVAGVSWYEADAYARFAGGSLPTAFHWSRAAGPASIFSDILRASRFGGSGTVAVGTTRGLGPFGTLDMAGNVKEWVSTAHGQRRLVLGGAWSEPVYMFWNLDSAAPFDRRTTFGIRTIRSVGPVAPGLQTPVTDVARDFDRETPASDEVFAAYARLYAYDPRPLDTRVVRTDESNPYWRREEVSFTAAYGGERVPAFVFIPRQAAPPYQAVVYHPSGEAPLLPSSREVSMLFVDFVIRSGRVLVYPILKGTYERRVAYSGRNEFRDLVVQRAKDIGRSVDYLASRGDIDMTRVAYYGASLGAQIGLTAAAVERRFRTVVLAAGGLRGRPDPPEIDTLHFVPRITVPTLMVNGRDDFDTPLQTMQLPLFARLGAPPGDKKHVILDGGHVPLRLTELIRTVLDWLDERMGPVATTGGSAGR